MECAPVLTLPSELRSLIVFEPLVREPTAAVNDAGTLFSFLQNILDGLSNRSVPSDDIIAPTTT